MEQLDWARSHSRAGQLLDRVLELDFDVSKFRIDWGDVPAEERQGLRILDEERAKKRKEDDDERQREWEAKNIRR